MNEPMYSFKYTKLTKEQIDQKLAADSAGPVCASEYSDVLAGKSLKIVTNNGPRQSNIFWMASGGFIAQRIRILPLQRSHFKTSTENALFKSSAHA
jgi:hypothetical protein